MQFYLNEVKKNHIYPLYVRQQFFIPQNGFNNLEPVNVAANQGKLLWVHKVMPVSVHGCSSHHKTKDLDRKEQQ